MSVRIHLLCLSIFVSLSACVAQDAAELEPGGEAALSSVDRAITITEPVSQIPLPIYPVYAESWSPRTSAALTWPSATTRVQVIIRRGYAPTLFTSGTFYVFIVSDGARLRRVLHISNNDYNAFRAHLHTVFTAAETPDSEHSYSIAGGTYVGPHPAGPPGDPISPTLINRILTSASAIDDFAQQAITETF